MDTLSCKIVLRPGSEVSIVDSNQGSNPHLTAQVGQMSHPTVTAEEPKTHGKASKMMSTTWQKVKVHGPVARVHVADERNVDYSCQPAVSDSSMHIGILAGQPDGKIRIPGEHHSFLEAWYLMFAWTCY